jgi:hypothetical protein
MSNPRFGVYWSPAHTDNSYKDVIGAIGGPVRILGPDVQHIVDVAARTPDEIWPRWWDLDDNDYKVIDLMKADPEGCGEQMALAMMARRDQFRQQATERKLPFPDNSRFRFSGINEPPIWTDVRDKFVRCEVRFLDTLTAHNEKGNAFRLGVGHPADLVDGKPNWQPYTAIYEAIKRGNGLHALELHEYWYWTGPQDGWTWLAGRYLQCPWDVDIHIGESGVDNFVDNQRWQKESSRSRGWKGNVSAHDLAWNHYGYYFDHADSRIKVVLDFELDHQARQWDSFDIYDARNEFISWWQQQRQKTRVEAAEAPFKVFVPMAASNAPSGPPVQPGATVESIPVAEEKKIMVDAKLTPDLVWWFVGECGRVLGIESRLAKAFIQIESGLKAGQMPKAPDMIIRFEPHIFKGYIDQGTFDQHFKIGSPIWDGNQHQVNLDGAWQSFHGNQGLEWAALRLALGLNEEGAYRSISMGAAQIMGFNYATVGYQSAKQMFGAYNDEHTGSLAQITGFFAYVLNTGGLWQACQQRDFATMARLYNGSGAVASYSALLQGAYNNNVN